MRSGRCFPGKGRLGTAVLASIVSLASLSAALSVPLRAQDTTGVRAVSNGVLVDFQDVDLRVVIAALAEAGGLNVVCGELPQRRITLRLRQPVARDQILPLLRSIAASNGLTIEPEGALLRVVTEGQARSPRSQAGQGAADQAEARLFVHRLRHARAPRIAATLQAIFGRAGEDRGDAGRRQPLSEQLRDQRIRPAGDSSARADTATAIAGLVAQIAGDVRIVPDEATNSLVVRALPEDWATIQQAVQALDLRPLQVVIEVLIAEVRNTRGAELGVAAKAVREGSGRNKVEASLASSSATDFVAKLLSGGRIDVDVALSALATRGTVRILSRPLLLAQNNQEARILVGSERPFVQVFRSLPTDAGVRDQVVQYRDVGTSLTITPTINPDEYVNLQVVQEVSTATSESQFGAPVISTREASTHLFVRNGQTAVFGGLIDRQSDRSRSGIPLLSAIPLLGALFGTTRVSSVTNELFLFLTPHLIRTDEELDALRQRIGNESMSDELRREPPSILRDTSRVRPRRPRPEAR